MFSLSLTRILKILFYRLLGFIPYFHFFKNSNQTQCPITFRTWFIQKVLGYNKNCYWPVHFSSIVTYPQYIHVGIDTNPGYSPGCNIHGVNGIYIDDYTQIASGDGIQSGNHSPYDNRIQLPAPPIRIGKYCWIGQNAVILPGVVLGDFTIVGAGAIVTKSFEEGYCVIGGVPAIKIKTLAPINAIKFQNEIKLNGYIDHEKFLTNYSKFVSFDFS